MLGILFTSFFLVEAMACDFMPTYTPQKYDDGLVLSTEWVTRPQNWAAPAVQNSALEDFQGFVASRTSVDPLYLLKRQSQIFHDNNLGSFVKRTDAVIAGQFGRIDDLGCIDGSLFSMHRAVRGKNIETEFATYIFEKQDAQGAHLKIYHVDSEELSVRFPKGLDAELVINVLSGWTFLVHLHSHPFLFDNPGGDIAGTTVPSDPDMATYRMMSDLYGLQNAWVTNGFSTIKIKSEEFGY